MDHFFPLGFGKGFFCVLVSGTGGDMTIGGCVWLFLLKSAFKNKKNCFNSYFLLWIKMLTVCHQWFLTDRQLFVKLKLRKFDFTLR